LVLLHRGLVQFLDHLGSVIELPLHRTSQPTEFGLVVMDAEFVLDNLGVNLLIELAEITKDCVHLLELLNHKTVLVDDRFDRYAASHKHVVDSDVLRQLFVVYHLLEFGYFVVQRDHPFRAK
jgi:hypothetical protein